MANSKRVSDVRKNVRARWSNFPYNVRNDIAAPVQEDTKTRNEIDECGDSSQGLRDTQERNLGSSNAIENERKQNFVEIVDLTSDNEETDPSTSETDLSEKEEPIPPPAVNFPFKLIKSDIYDANKKSCHFVTLGELFSAPQLSATWLFSFQYELDYILPMFHDNVDITLVAQEGTVLPPTLVTPRIAKLLSRMKTFLINMPPFTCHHSKMVINQYRDRSVRIFIPSNNFTSTETNLPQQIVWNSPLLPFKGAFAKEKSPSQFRNDLLLYLDTYPCDLKPLCSVLEAADFTSLDNTGTQFIYSTPKPSRTKKPGHSVPSGIRLLHQRLYQFHHIDSQALVTGKKHHYLCQVSSIGAPLRTDAKKPANLFTHLMVPLFSGLIHYNRELTQQRINGILETDQLRSVSRKNNIKAYIVYPTKKEVNECPMSYMTGGWFHFNWIKNDITKMHYYMLKQGGILHKQINPAEIRGTTPSHTKFYMKSTTTSENQEPFREVDWCLFTTANLSGHAWGTPTRKPQNFEVGVLLSSSDDHLLTVKSASDLVYTDFRGQGRILGRDASRVKQETCIMIPFTVPPAPYEKSDDSFCISKDLDQAGSS